jgi:phosphopantothenoylcysteine decarboxylase/phosphopantothenate--cysteine ligase
LCAKVTLVLGPVPGSEFLVSSSRVHRKPETKNKKLKTIHVVSAWDMYQAVKKYVSGTDVFVGTAAVVDYRPANPLKRKIKHHHPEMSLRLYGNPDIIAMVGHLPKGRPRCVVGFALETDHLMKNALDKLLRKRMDWIMANRESNMGNSKGSGTLLSRWGHRIVFKRTNKEQLAKQIWQSVLNPESLS